MPSAFLGIYKAVFAYQPQSEQELSLREGDILYVTEKSSDDDWWTAKKKTGDDEEEEPVGLVPNNYIEEATPIGKCKALYDYERQTEEELSFMEDSVLDVYDSSDPDWILVGFNGEYGFAPSNYIEQGEADEGSSAAAAAPAQHHQQAEEEEDEAPPPMPPRPTSIASHDYAEEESDHDNEPAKPSPAAAVAAILQRKQAAEQQAQREAPQQQHYEQPEPSPPAIVTQPVAQEAPRRKKVNFTPPPDDSDEEGREEPSPRLPPRPRTDSESEPPLSPPPPTSFSQIDVVGIHTYQVNEVISKKKHPATLELGNGHIKLTPHRKNIPSQQWTIEDLKEWSADGKRVGLDLVHPERSLDLHVGSKDAAEEILSDIVEMRSLAQSNVHLRDVMVAATSGGKKLGTVMYNFDAQGDDEVTVRVGDDVIILDDTKSSEWWMVRRVATNKEGVVPSSYVEVKKGAFEKDEEEDATPQRSGSRARSASGKSYGHSHQDSVGPGMKLPVRGSSLASSATSAASQAQVQRRPDNGKQQQAQAAKTRPNPKNVRTWTDRTGTFNVDAEFLNCRDGVIHLHKVNGIKIAVPVVKMSRNDLEYVERVTGQSLDEEKPLSDIRNRNSTNAARTGSPAGSGITIDRSKQAGPRKDDYDWFEFFLACGVDVHACQRYATNFHKDNMDETILPEITNPVLRTLGLKEGDILRVMKFLDLKYNRKSRGASGDDADGEEGGSQGGLFAGPGGALKNNTRKGRPAPPVQTSDVVDPKAFEPKAVAEKVAAAAAAAPAEKREGFADDAWTPKPAKQEPPKAATPPPPQPAAVSPPPQPEPQPLTGALKELSILTPPLQPTVVAPSVQPTPLVQAAVPAPAPAPIPQVQTSPPPQQQWQAPPANILAAPLSSAQAGMAGIGQNVVSPPPQQYQQFQPQQQQQQQYTMGRQRPAAPQIAQGTGVLAPPPPARPLSAPGQQTFQPPQMQPLQPNVTGFPNAAGFQQSTPMIMQPTGFNPNFQQPQNGYLQQQVTGFPQQQQQALPPQMTGFPQQQFPQQQQLPLLPEPTGVLPPLRAPFQPTVDLSMPTPLIPQKPAHLGVGGTNSGLMQPLKPQATGPPPSVKFGVKKLTPQPTGRKANLGAATPENPFGF